MLYFAATYRYCLTPVTCRHIVMHTELTISHKHSKTINRLFDFIACLNAETWHTARYG